MRITHFKVERYRSIVESESIDLSQMSVLVGPNNEGKSNILRALVVGLQALSRASSTTPRNRQAASLRQTIHDFEQYVWERDFPLKLQAKSPGANTILEFEFELNSSDTDSFKEEFGHKLNGTLKLRVLLGNGSVEYKITKKGRGTAGMNEKVGRVCLFVSRRIKVRYIPALRTSDESLNIIRGEIRESLAQLYDRPEVKKLFSELDDLLKQSLEPLNAELRSGVQEFLPNVNRVDLSIDVRKTLPLRISPDIMVDDGEVTSLEAKGDGIQSLTAISFFARQATRANDVTFVLAIEEPEAHLHPGAVRKLREVLEKMARENQVILTTHSPVLVMRDYPEANILVSNNRAAPAKTMESIRTSLGVEVPDNMSASEVVLLTEGRHDQKIVQHLLARNPAIGPAIKSGRLVIKEVGGAANMHYGVRLHQDALCKVHILLDDDKAGRDARKKVEECGTVADADITVISSPTANECEIEDLFAEEAFKEMLLADFNVALTPGVTQAEKRFSLRMQDYFKASGQGWKQSHESNVKNRVADYIVTNDLEISPQMRGVYEALERAIQGKIGSAQIK